MTYRFKLRQHQHKNSKIVFRSAWFTAADILDAITRKDNFLAAHPEYNDCWVTWESK